MRLSVLLLTWNSHEFIPRCLDSLAAHAPSIGEVIVVDNGSSDDSIALVKKHCSEAILITNKRNRGVAAGRNQGLRVAKGNYVLLLDIDTVVHPGAIDALLGTMDRDQDVGLAGARLVGIDGQVQNSCRRFPTVIGKLGRRLSGDVGEKLSRPDELSDWPYVSRRYVDYVIGACQIIRRSAMEDVGLLDERIFYGPEDVDYCLRMWQAGWRVLYEPEAVITHIQRRITQRSPLTNPLFWKHVAGLIRYFWKHQYLFHPPQGSDGLGSQ